MAEVRRVAAGPRGFAGPKDAARRSAATRDADESIMSMGD
jgi:hypothetical protein